MSLVEYGTIEQQTPTGKWIDLIAPAAALANQIAKTEFVPQEMRGKPDVVAACILYGDEIGIGPMMALAKVDIVKGRPAPKAELARALALAAGHQIEVRESTNTRVTVAGRRSGSEFWQTVTWTMDDVKKAGIVNQAYAKYPRQMLLARASAELVRAMCPDVLGGITRFSEEYDDTDPDTGPASRVTATVTAAPAGRKRQRAPLPPVAELAPPPLPGEDDEEPVAELATDAQITKLVICFKELGISDREDRVQFLRDAIGRHIDSSKEMTRAEASAVIDKLESAPPSDEPPLDEEPF